MFIKGKTLNDNATPVKVNKSVHCNPPIREKPVRFTGRTILDCFSDKNELERASSKAIDYVAPYFTSIALTSADI